MAAMLPGAKPLTMEDVAEDGGNGRFERLIEERAEQRKKTKEEAIAKVPPSYSFLVLLLTVIFSILYLERTFSR